MGRETYVRTTMVMDDSDSVLMPAMPGDLSYAVYKLHVGRFSFDKVEFVLWDTTRPEGIWIGVADYMDQEWVWTQYTPGMTSVDTTSISPKSSNGDVFIAIAAYDDTFTKVVRSYVTVEVPTWDRYTIDDLDSPGATSSMVRMGNFVGILYEKGDGAGGYTLKFAKPTVLAPTGPADWLITDVQVSYAEPTYDIKLIGRGGLPAFAMLIGHSTPGFTNVWYAYGDIGHPADSSAWNWSSVGVGVTGDGLDLALIDGNPAVAYESQEMNGGFSVRYARATRPDPQSTLDWSIIEAGASWSPTQDYSGIHLYQRADKPVLQYYDIATDHLEMATTTSASPADYNDFIEANVDSQMFYGQINTGVEYGGRPVCIYSGTASGALLYARSSEMEPTGPDDFYQRHMIEDTPVANVEVVRLELGMGIAYRDLSDNTIHFAWVDSGTPGSGSSWNILQVDDRATSGDIGVAMNNDHNPCISYHTISPDALQFAVMVP